MMSNNVPKRSRTAALMFTAALSASVALPAVAGTSLRYAEDQGPGIVQPMFTTSMAEARLNELLFEGLYTDDLELQTVGALAQSATPSQDRRELTVQLRQDRVWHDGTPITADDVVFTVQAMKNPQTLSTEFGRVDWIRSVEAQGPTTVRFVFAKPELRAEDKLYFKVLPRHAFGSTTVKRSDAFRSNPVGSGPYRWSSFNEDGSITLERVADHPSPGRLDQIVMREVSDKAYQAKLLLYESLEALVRVLPRDLAVLQANRAVELYPYQTNSWWYVGFQSAHPALADRRVREAIARAIDVPSLLAPIGTGELLSGPFVRSSPYYNHEVAPWTKDSERTQELMRDAGYAWSEGHWLKSGKPLSLSLVAHKGQESAQEVVINLQSQLAQEGFDLLVTFLDDASWKGQVWRERDFDLVLSQWSFDRNEDIREQFASSGSRNFYGYRSKTTDELLERARTTLDPQEKKDALRQVHRQIHDDLPVLVLWTLDSYCAMNTKVKNVFVHPFYFFTWVNQWRMD